MATTAVRPEQSAPHKVPPPKITPKMARVLEAMRHAYTWGHPDLQGEFRGTLDLFKGDYAGALKNFKYGAYYSDKPSQAAIAMMYLNGRGVPKDKATACAWLRLAAERKYPMYVQVRDAVCKALTLAQHRRVKAVLARLKPVYGDKVAKVRLEHKLRVVHMILVGPRIGDSWNVRVIAPSWALVSGGNAPPVNTACYAPTLYVGAVQVAKIGCGSYNPTYWKAKSYMAARNELSARVRVGPLQVVKEPGTKAGAPAAASSSRP